MEPEFNYKKGTQKIDFKMPVHQAAGFLTVKNKNKFSNELMFDDLLVIDDNSNEESQQSF